MSISLAIAILAVFATLAVAFLQPVVTNWLAPKQKLRVDVIASEFAIPPTISREMANFGIKLYVQGKPKGVWRVPTKCRPLRDLLRRNRHEQR
jgi:hypothetical protein